MPGRGGEARHEPDTVGRFVEDLAILERIWSERAGAGASVERCWSGRSHDDGHETEHAMPLILALAVGGSLMLLVLAVTAAPRPRPTQAQAAPDAGTRAPDAAGRGDLLAGLAVGALAALGTQAFLGWPALSMAAGVVGALLPAWYRGQRAERQRDAMAEAVAEAVDTLRDASRVGIGVETALRSLAESGPAALRPALRPLDGDLRHLGFEEAVRRARAAVAHPAFDMLAVALLMSYQVGGRNLSAVLDGLGRSLRATARARREVRAQQAEQVMSARVIAAIPLFLIIAIRALSPDYLSPFSSPLGQVLIAGGLVMIAGGYVWMKHTTRLPGHERVLR